MRIQKLTVALIVFAQLAAVAVAHAAQPAWPDKPIRLVVGSAAGSGPDIIARVMAERLYGVWGQRVVVDPRPGVAGLLSADIVTRSAADGYTWMMMTSQLFVATVVYSNHKIDLARDFASISLIGTVPYVLVVNPSVARTITELIEAGKKSPGTLRYGSAGAGGGEHLTSFLFGHMAGVNFLHVPYKGIPQALADTVAREVHFSTPVLAVALPFVQSGRLRALGITTRQRAALLPDVAPIAEVLPGYENFGWYSLVAPTGTPPAVLTKASAEVVKAVKEPQFGEQLKSLGIDLVGGTRSEFDTFRRNETKRVGEIVKASGVDLK
jgi:tripartite-type tricarboxylate transporter receptor subunit TctC